MRRILVLLFFAFSSLFSCRSYHIESYCMARVFFPIFHIFKSKQYTTTHATRLSYTRHGIIVSVRSDQLNRTHTCTGTYTRAPIHTNTQTKLIGNIRHTTTMAIAPLGISKYKHRHAHIGAHAIRSCLRKLVIFGRFAFPPFTRSVLHIEKLWLRACLANAFSLTSNHSPTSCSAYFAQHTTQFTTSKIPNRKISTRKNITHKQPRATTRQTLRDSSKIYAEKLLFILMEFLSRV